MNLDRYEVLTNAKHQTYEFLSEGPKGTIKKVVVYQKIPDQENIFNLAFGDWDEGNRKINDKSRSNNDDRNKVLATVAFTVTDFIKHSLHASILAIGSTPSRTRLYEMAINAHWDEINENFDVFGHFKGNWELVERGKHYDAFLLSSQ